jgi:membrane-bound lytic murein transglycosylase MltF
MRMAPRVFVIALIISILVCSCSRESAPAKPALQSGAASAPAAVEGDLPPADGTPARDMSAPPALPSVLDLVIEPHTGDLDEILKRRQIRMLVATDRTHFFFDGGEQKGVTADAIAEFDRWINKELKTPKNQRIQVVVAPMRRDQLTKALLEGRGDVIATYVTVTPERRKQVDFADAGFKVNEVFVTGKTDVVLTNVDQLAGREASVRRGSAYYESLIALNAKFAERGLKPVVIRELDPAIETDEALEMINAGVIQATVADRYVAKLWANILPEIQVHEAVVLRADAPFTWAVRKDSPKLRELISKFQKTHGEGTLWGNMKLKEYFVNGKLIQNPRRAQDAERLRETRKLFEQYGGQYSLDWLLVAAQAYQESGLDHGRKSHVGAIGIMQVMPATARDPRIGIPNIQELDRNIEAGTKYLRFVIDQYYKDEPMTRIDKALFALASYNAGPAKVAKLRAEAKKIGLDPNVWFENVEIVAARRVGAETVTYVRNIHKYYLAYKLMEEQGAIKPATVANKS